MRIYTKRKHSYIPHKCKNLAFVRDTLLAPFRANARFSAVMMLLLHGQCTPSQSGIRRTDFWQNGCTHRRRSDVRFLSYGFPSSLPVDVAVQPMPDPCLPENHKTLSDVRRSTGFKTGYPEIPLCDINIASGWYRFVVDAESKMPETCVASPSVTDGIQRREACANFQSDVTDTACCGYSFNIGVKNRIS